MQIRNLKSDIQIYIAIRSRIIDVPKSANPGKIGKNHKVTIFLNLLAFLFFIAKRYHHARLTPTPSNKMPLCTENFAHLHTGE
jgi:hypothetical protein